MVNGRSILFWSDKCNSEIFDTTYPRLYSFLKARFSPFSQSLSITDVGKAFHLPLSTQAANELTQLQAVLHGMILNPDEEDKWTIIHTKNASSTRWHSITFQIISHLRPVLIHRNVGGKP
jgi:hypothetical protein